MLGLVLAVLALARGGGEASATSPTITARPAAGGEATTWTLRCSPAGGTLPSPARACARLARLEHPFAPVPRTMLCTDIYGGPQVARVRGTYRGQKLDTSFRRTNGCEIRRWYRVSFLFPIVTGTEPPPR